MKKIILLVVLFLAPRIGLAADVLELNGLNAGDVSVVMPDIPVNIGIAKTAVPGLRCEVKQFEIILEGWSRLGKLEKPEPCSVLPISTQTTCTDAPCYNVACDGLVHYRAIVELSPEEHRLWPSCYFKQQRMGSRSHSEEGKKVYNQFESDPAYDFEGAVGDAPYYKMAAVAGQPNTYQVDFYDLPGWRAAYINGRPNAVAPEFFPLDWNYMYRAYLGPKRYGFLQEDYRYIKVKMETLIPPASEMNLYQANSSLKEWYEFQKELKSLNIPPIASPSWNQ